MRVGRANGREWLRLGEAASALGVSPNTLRRWSDAGGIACYRSPGGHRRYRRADVEALLPPEGGALATRQAPGAAAVAHSSDARLAPDQAPAPPAAGQDDPGAGSAHPALVFPAPASTAAALTPDSLVLSVFALLRAQPALAACTLYAVDGTVAAPFPAGDHDGNPVDGGRPWRLDEFPAAAQAAAAHAPVLVSSETADPPPPATVRRFLTERGLSGVMLTPVVFWDHLVGVLELGAATPDGLSVAQHIAPLTAGLLAPVLGSGEVIAGLQRRSRDLALVVEAGLQDAARLSPDDLLDAVVERLSTLTGTPVVDVYALEGDTLRALVSYDGGRFDTDWAGVVLPLRRYPCSRHAIETGEITVVPTLDDPHLDDDDRYSLEKWGYRSQLSMPLVSRGRPLGVVELYDYQPRDFAVDLDLIRGLGQVATRALENASFLDEVDRRTRTLNELVELGSLVSRTRDLDHLVPAVAERVLTTVEAANCDLYRMIAGRLICVASFDRSGHDGSVLGDAFDPERYPTVAETLQARHILTITSPDDPQLSEAERAHYRDYGFASEVCLPLVVDDEVYGLLDVYDTRERDFSEYLSFLRSAAQTLAGAFQNAVLVEQLELRATILRDIVDLGAVASQTQNLQELLTVLADRLRATIDAAACDIYVLRDDKLRCLVSLDRRGLHPGAVGQILDMARFPATALAVRSGQAVAIPTLDDPRLSDAEREDMSEHGYQSELCIPLIGGAQVIGIIDIFDTRPRDYSGYLDFLRSVGQTAAGAIENALLRAGLERPDGLKR